MFNKGIKQSTLNFILGGLSIILSIILVILSLNVMNAFFRMKVTEERKTEFRQLGFDLLNSSDYLTNQIRAYVQFGDQQYYDNYWKEVNETQTRDKVIVRLTEMGTPQNELDLLAQAKSNSDNLVAIEEAAMAEVEQSKFQEARVLVFGTEYEKVKETIKTPIMDFVDMMTKRVMKDSADATAKVQSCTITMIILMCITALFSVFSLLISHFKIIKPMISIKDSMTKFAEGNLSQTFDVPINNSEIGQLANAATTAMKVFRNVVDETSSILTEMSNGNLVVEITSEYKGDFAEIKSSLNNIILSFNDVLRDVKNAADQVSSASNQVSSSSMMLSQGASTQASSVEELTASLEEIAAQTKLNANNANNADGLSKSARDSVLEGNELMEKMLAAMDDINESSTSISKIIKVIDDIAFQTNILALNAAVEAARAGQHGKGFAVVAEEVRTLAARSAMAAQETTSMIESSIQKTEDGAKVAKQTADALHKIVNEIEEVAVLVMDIATASNEQSMGISQINQGIIQVSDVVQSNSATSEESAAASEELASQAEVLKEMVNKFRLKNESHRISNMIW